MPSSAPSPPLAVLAQARITRSTTGTLSQWLGKVDARILLVPRDRYFDRVLAPSAGRLAVPFSDLLPFISGRARGIFTPQSFSYVEDLSPQELAAWRCDSIIFLSTRSTVSPGEVSSGRARTFFNRYAASTALEAAEARRARAAIIGPCKAWLRGHRLGGTGQAAGLAVAAAEGGEEEGVEQCACRSALLLCEAALASQLSASASEQLEAEERLRAAGLSAEQMALPQAQLQPLLYEIGFARAVGSRSEALRRMPPPLEHGPPQEGSVMRDWLFEIETEAEAEAAGAEAAGAEAEADDPSPPPGAPGTPSLPAALAAPKIKPLARMVVARQDAEDMRWLEQLPPRVEVHVVQKGAAGGEELELPPERLTKLPDVGSVCHSFLHWLASAAKQHEYDTRKLAKGRTRAHVELEPGEQKASIQERFHEELRRRGARVQDLLRSGDANRDYKLDKEEFRGVLKKLGVRATEADFDSVFVAWDSDESGSMEYLELLSALSGVRYDAFRTPPPDLPPLLIFTPADPFVHNPRFLQDVRLLLARAASGAPLPPFTPLGLWRGEVPSSQDRPSWQRPEVHCDASGWPQHREMLPLGAAWRHLFGEEQPMPLWLGYTPGSLFAVPSERIFQPRPRPHNGGGGGAARPKGSNPKGGVAHSKGGGARAAEAQRVPDGLQTETEPASAFFGRALSTCGLDLSAAPVARHAMERLWRYVLLGPAEYPWY